MFHYQSLLNNFMQLLPYALLAVAIISLWIEKQRWMWMVVLCLAILAGWYAHRLAPIALISIVALGLGCFLTFHVNNKILKIVFTLITLLLCIALFFHYMPGFYNLEVVHQYKLTKKSLPYTLFLNFDKPLVGLFILGFGWKVINQSGVYFKNLMISFFITLVLLVVLPFIALSMHYVKFEPKWDSLFYLWAINNLLFVCVAEEAFFRGFIQGGLMNLWRKVNYGKLYALLVASILFGLAHFRGGINYIILATIAGLFYGTSYLASRRIEASIIPHFLLNTMHFIFYSYPALA